VEQFPDHTELRLAYARILVQAKRYDEALVQFKRVV
jgi:thioredoxin-like negative regulator of GroEL